MTEPTLDQFVDDWRRMREANERLARERSEAIRLVEMAYGILDANAPDARERVMMHLRAYLLKDL